MRSPRLTECRFRLFSSLPAGLLALSRLSLIVLLLPFAACAADDEAGYVSLFNGKDLSGWDCKPGSWKVENGTIRPILVPELRKNWLIWQGGEPADFELRLQFRFSGTVGNSGVQVRSIDLGEWQVHGYQVEIATHEHMGLWHESRWSEEDRRFLATAGQRVSIALDGTKTVEQFAPPAEIQAACRDGEWNDLVVIAKGPRITQIINGVVFSDLTDEYSKGAWRSGVLALQNTGKGAIEFKAIRLRETK